MNKNYIIIGGVLAVAIGIGYWYYVSNKEKDTETINPETKDTEAITPEDKKEL